MDLSIRERRRKEVEEDVYDEDTRQELVDGDEMSIDEEGFMQGYTEGIE